MLRPGELVLRHVENVAELRLPDGRVVMHVAVYGGWTLSPAALDRLAALAQELTHRPVPI